LTGKVPTRSEVDPVLSALFSVSCVPVPDERRADVRKDRRVTDTHLAADVADLTVGLLGGTGRQGKGLALRWALSGQRVVLGSRDPARARQAALDIGAGTPADSITGTDNRSCAALADLVVVAVPWLGHAETLTELHESLRGKVVVDCVNPIGFDDQGPYALTVPEGSAAEQAAALLPESRIVAAFHHVSAPLLADRTLAEIETDVLVLGDDREATDVVQALAARIPGVRGVYAGRLRNTHQVEALTVNLIAVNRRYKAHAGLRVTDV
jgi:NADPH-dependent F420 reductase